jgi:hypothetical protein
MPRGKLTAQPRAAGAEACEHAHKVGMQFCSNISELLEVLGSSRPTGPTQSQGPLYFWQEGLAHRLSSGSSGEGDVQWGGGG